MEKAKVPDAFRFSGDDALNYETWLGPLLFEPSAKKFLSYLGDRDIGSILEISAGTGRLTRHLREFFPSTTKLIVSDISPDMLELARQRLNDPSIEFQLADAQQLPFSDCSFDMVVCHYGLMFLQDRRKGFHEVYRVLKPGGRFIFSTWDSPENIPLFDLIINGVIIPFFAGEDPARFRIPFSLYQPERLMDLLEGAGFGTNQVLPVEFKSGAASKGNVVNSFLLKHPLGNEVAKKDPAALVPMAEELDQRLSAQFGNDTVFFDLKAFFGIGQKGAIPNSL